MVSARVLFPVKPKQTINKQRKTIHNDSNKKNEYSEILDSKQHSGYNKIIIHKLIGFKFKKHSRYNLPAKRLRMIERMIQKRVQELLV